LLSTATRVFGQVSFTIGSVSANYYGKVYLSDTTQESCAGWIAVCDKKTNKELVKVKSEELPSFNPDSVMPYDGQECILYDDFDFDGKKDLAISDGLNSLFTESIWPPIADSNLVLNLQTFLPKIIVACLTTMQRRFENYTQINLCHYPKIAIARLTRRMVSSLPIIDVKSKI
jgi:hypothetical protein